MHDLALEVSVVDCYNCLARGVFGYYKAGKPRPYRLYRITTISGSGPSGVSVPGQTIDK